MSNPHIDIVGTKRWFNKKGQLHRTDGPAKIWKDGEKHWFIDGKEVKPIPDHIILWRKKLSNNNS